MKTRILFLNGLADNPTEKGDAILRAINFGEGAHEVLADELRHIPNSPFAYWLSRNMRTIFRTAPPLIDQFDVKQGLATADDFRFLRLWWEVNSKDLGFQIEDCKREKAWFHFAKGGSFGRFYSDLHLIVDWSHDGSKIKGFFKTDGSLASRPQSTSYYFRPGLTWPLRTNGLSFRAVPYGCIFGHKGPMIFDKADDVQRLKSLNSIASSGLYYQLVRPQIARVELAQSFEVGIISLIPTPKLSRVEFLAELFDSLYKARRFLDTATEISHAFRLPWLLHFPGVTLSQRNAAYSQFVSSTQAELERLQTEIDNLAFDLYELGEEDRQLILDEMYGAAAPAPVEDEDEAVETEGADEDAEEGEEEAEVVADFRTQVERLLSWCVGAAFGRWDVRMALDSSLIPELQGPFERLPVVAPAGLVGVDGYPAEGKEVAPVEWLKARPNVISLPEGEWANTREYPLDVAWDGLLVSDSGNPRDLARRVRSVLRLIFGERGEAIEDEMTAALRGDAKKALSLEEYFANPKHFFASHLKTYSKSRRKAPIYWPLRTRDGGFTAWVYYPRMTTDTLPTLIADVIAPRVAVQRSEVERLRSERDTAQGKLFGTLGKELDAAQALLDGLTELEARLRELVNAGYTVEHDDGVILSAAPLHDLMPWKDLTGMFRNIAAGKYPWSHQHTLWVKA